VAVFVELVLGVAVKVVVEVAVKVFVELVEGGGTVGLIDAASLPTVRSTPQT